MEPLKYVYDPNDYSVGAHQGVAADPVRMHPHRPSPELATGYLEVDPEIRLKARGFDLTVAFHYSSRADVQTEYGYGRSATVRAYALSAVDGKRVTIVRGDFNEAYYDVAGSSGGVTTFTTLAGSGVRATLTYSGGDFVERFPDGMQLVYHSQVGGTPVKHELVRVADARGNAQTYVYGTGAEAGLLKSIEAPGGGKVTLTYGAGKSQVQRQGQRQEPEPQRSTESTEAHREGQRRGRATPTTCTPIHHHATWTARANPSRARPGTEALRSAQPE